MCHTQLIKQTMSYTETFHNKYPEAFSDSESEEYSTLIDPSVAYTENGALATSLHGMTTVVRKDLAGLSIMGVAITSGMDDENELWGRLLGELFLVFSLPPHPQLIFSIDFFYFSHQHLRCTQCQ